MLIQIPDQGRVISSGPFYACHVLLDEGTKFDRAISVIGMMD